MLILDEREIDACERTLRERFQQVGTITVDWPFAKLRASARPLTVTDANAKAAFDVFTDCYDLSQGAAIRQMKAALEHFIRAKGTT